MTLHSQNTAIFTKNKKTALGAGTKTDTSREVRLRGTQSMQKAQPLVTLIFPLPAMKITSIPAETPHLIGIVSVTVV